MTFKPIARKSSVAPAVETEPHEQSIRFANHGASSYQKDMTQIWIARDLAVQIGLTDDRNLVDFFLDDSDPAVLRAAISRNPEGEFKASRRWRNVVVYINSATSLQCFGEVRWCSAMVDQSTIRVNGDRLEFVVPLAEAKAAAERREAALSRFNWPGKVPAA